jgi:hypothetical protein
MIKERLSKLKPLVNHKQWEQFNNYLNDMIELQQKSLEQADNDILVYRSQGAIAALRRLTNLRTEVRDSDGNSI